MTYYQTDLEIFLKVLSGNCEEDYLPHISETYSFDLGGETLLYDSSSIFIHVGYSILTSQEANVAFTGNATHQKLVGLIWCLNEYVSRVHLDEILGESDASFVAVGYRQVLQECASTLIRDLEFNMAPPNRSFDDVFLSWGIKTN